eukprot:PhF_6_TR41471/c0_g1_i1/m.62874
MKFFLLIALFVVLATAQCGVILTPCDQTWGSRQNQTFAYVGVGGPYVQLNSYWGNNNACLGVQNGNLTLGIANCVTPTSLFSYGPGDLKSFVYFMHNQTQTCLTNSNGTLGLSACRKGNPDNQMWLEPPTTTDPYNRIFNKVNYATKPFCLTRVGDDGKC